ncbi:MAG: alpha/beta hydrolase [Planctomycetales bacterium]|nr:alpha/beta hydrolase [Planctomycetales bacterium]
MFRVTLLACLIFCFTSECVFSQKEVTLWENGVPGAAVGLGDESVRITESGERVVSNVHSPTLTIYLPETGKGNGSALIIAPGGGHRELWTDHEGHNWAKLLSAHGVVACVLKYRLAQTVGANYTVDEHALADMQRAIRWVRYKAKEWNVDPLRVGVAGFSAGGEVAGLAAIRFDAGDSTSLDPIERESSRPGYHALIYPGRSSRLEPNAGTPPVFIVCGYKDRPDISKGMAELYLKYKELDIAAELHIYANAGHGFGVREKNTGSVSSWPVRFEEWLAELKFNPAL